ncbi:2-succinyl-5-enolpyruvyl-6-hydroxy-3-cyclohexene-1-carboxylic-acid synthase [Ochrovirga pacifica]|uniref:2-succinyl-5-enolpyruvyl-6-hydroxy-3- cyclohexene-1-carboxylic-acid synthase n=1 Tax=Ochrovirga pacifica TaxID=1042376 RepID=UPI0002559AE6|nr:2-succinyl-5-enolpyruvyl-6-hydroxy-3-cyclohexene-1-carboxylic-acid synthase [Ochrovirga pacifica]
MVYPKNKLAQVVIASSVANQLADVVISPGSRNAPLTIGFSAVENIQTHSIVDERCAAFVALGMSQKTNHTTAVLCSSGSALLNYYPAVAEAFYSHIPLVIISADRPKNKIDIGDGQTIRQEGVFGNHILFQANLKEIQNQEDETWNKELLFKAYQTAKEQKGPVHINVPFEEPLYDLVNELKTYPEILVPEAQEIQEELLDEQTLVTFSKEWNSANKKLVLVGVHQPDELLQEQINHLLKDPSVLVFTETTSNLDNQGVVNSIDQFLAGLSDEEKQELKPDILLSIGGMVVSKRIKQYLRTFSPKAHWVVHPHVGYDTYFCLSHHFKNSATLFFSQFFWRTEKVGSTYQLFGLSIKEKRKAAHNNYLLKAPYTDFSVFDCINQSLPKNTILQLANSATIRYAQLFDISKGIKVFCNRGTSGIDGSTSTAVGYAIKTQEQVVLVTGDLSFLYDSNALWNSEIPKNFRIIVVNNNGGGIFKILPGPKQTQALPYFETPHGLTAENLAKMYGFNYLKAENKKELSKQLKSFYKVENKPKLLEVFTPSDLNDSVLVAYFENFKK